MPYMAERARMLIERCNHAAPLCVHQRVSLLDTDHRYAQALARPGYTCDSAPASSSRIAHSGSSSPGHAAASAASSARMC